MAQNGKSETIDRQRLFGLPWPANTLLSFDPKREPTAPRDAATVIVLREGNGAALEVFCVSRNVKSGFMGGAVVFPGGKVDAGDAAEAWSVRATDPHPRGALFETLAAPSRAMAVAACRELLEEGAILPVDGALDATAALELRAELLSASTEANLIGALERRGLKLTLDRLVPWARWVTPEAESRRFDARFFLLTLPPGQTGQHDGHETTTSFWAAPAMVLDRFHRGEVALAPPTTRTLELLADARDVQGAFAMAATLDLSPICPVFVAGDPPYLALPGDPSHALAERRVPGPTRFVLREGRFVSEAAPGG